MPSYEREFYRTDGMPGNSTVWALHRTENDDLCVAIYRTRLKGTQKSSSSWQLAHFLAEATGPEAAALNELLRTLVPPSKDNKVERHAHRT